MDPAKLAEDVLAPFLSLMKTPYDTISKTAIQAVLDTIGPRLAAQERELAEALEYGRVTRNTLQKTVEQLSQAEADLEHAERNEEEQALTIQILNGRLSQAQADARKRLETFKAAYKEADAERYNLLEECRQEAEKWKAEDDMYGNNFHLGMAAGANWASLYFARVGRAIDAALSEPAQGQGDGQ